MIPSQFSLEHRLAELRPTPAELRLARDLDEARAAAIRANHIVGGRPAGRFETGRFEAGRASARASRLPAS